jgi:GT2 family glycosyltransferase
MAKFLIQCVVVLYGQRPDESQSLSSLIRICRSEEAIASQISILVQDNSPQIQEFIRDGSEEQHPIQIEYHHAPENLGLASAYNAALDLAKGRAIPWLLLLDQDTQLTRQFLVHLIEAIHQAESQGCCAIVPKLMRDQVILSPQIVGKVFYHRMAGGFTGVTAAQVVAFNSAACIRVQDLMAIGGFPGEFWLDYLDHMVFHRLQKAGGHVFVLDSQLEHNLSVANIESDVTNDRYENLLNAEWLFVRKTGWGGGPIVHRVRLLKRAFSHFAKLRNKSYALQTLRSAFS